MSSKAEGNDELSSNIHVSKHPVLYHKISILRSSSTAPQTFRTVLRELTYHLGYEATACMTTRPIQISVSTGKEDPEEHLDCEGHKLVERVALIPILRSGLGMCDGMLELLPNCAVHHIGMYRIPGCAPVQYFNRLPRKCNSDIAIVLDPVIGSGSTTMAVVALLKKWGVPKIIIVSVLGSKQGLKKLTDAHSDIHITVGMIDDEISDKGIVLPGLGDSGDRLFGTPVVDDDEALLHPSKRKRSDASP